MIVVIDVSMCNMTRSRPSRKRTERVPTSEEPSLTATPAHPQCREISSSKMVSRGCCDDPYTQSPTPVKFALSVKFQSGQVGLFSTCGIDTGAVVGKVVPVDIVSILVPVPVRM